MARLLRRAGDQIDAHARAGVRDDTTPMITPGMGVPSEGVTPMVPDQSREDFLPFLGRQAARTGARAAEEVLGFPGRLQDLAGFGHTLLSAAAAPIVDPIARQIEEQRRAAGMAEPERPSPHPSFAPFFDTRDQTVVDRAVADRDERIGFPRPEDIREQVTRRLTGDYLEPQTGAEKFADDVTQTLTGLLVPGIKAPGLKQGLIQAGRMLGIAGGAELSKLAADKMQIGPTGQDVIKNGFIMGGLILTGPRFWGNVRRMFSASEAALPAADSLKSSKVTPLADKLNEYIFEGRITPDETLRKRAGSFFRAVEGKEIPVSAVKDLYKDINNFWPDAKSFQKTYLKEIQQGANELLKEYGKHNPDFYNNWRMATDMTRAAFQQSDTAKWMTGKIDKIFNSSATPFFLFANPVMTLQTIGGALAARAAITVGDMIIREPSTLKLYGRILKEASLQNIGAVSQLAEKLDKKFQEYEKKNTIPEDVRRYMKDVVRESNPDAAEAYRTGPRLIRRAAP